MFHKIRQARIGRQEAGGAHGDSILLHRGAFMAELYWFFVPPFYQKSITVCTAILLLDKMQNRSRSKATEAKSEAGAFWLHPKLVALPEVAPFGHWYLAFCDFPQK